MLLFVKMVSLTTEIVTVGRNVMKVGKIKDQDLPGSSRDAVWPLSTSMTDLFIRKSI